MPISHTVWSLDAKKPLEAASLNDEKELELLLRDNIEILSKDWLVKKPPPSGHKQGRPSGLPFGSYLKKVPPRIGDHERQVPKK